MVKLGYAWDKRDKQEQEELGGFKVTPSVTMYNIDGKYFE